MSLLEFCLFKYEKTVQACVDSAQGDNTSEIEKSQAKVNAVASALGELQTQLAQQDADLAALEKAEADAKNAEQQQKAAEESVRQSEEEVKQGLAELQKEEDKFKDACDVLEKKANDPATSTVQKNKAAAELAQLKQTDNMALKKAQVNQENAVKKAEKKRKDAEAATAAVQAMVKDVQTRKKNLEEQKQKLEVNIGAMEKKMEEAMTALNENKKLNGVPNGALWWMEREVKEAQKYLPKKNLKSL